MNGMDDTDHDQVESMQISDTKSESHAPSSGPSHDVDKALAAAARI